MLWDLPIGYSIEKISKSHIEVQEGVLYQDLVSKFFIDHDF